MSNTESKAEDSKKPPVIHIVAIAAFVVLLVVVVLYSNVKKEPSIDNTQTETASTSVINSEVIKDQMPLDAEVFDNVHITPSIEDLSTPRILGNPNAPVKIAEHSSFTCGACARFHSENFKKIKADYIDTGKAYIVYDDFARNSQDLNIGMVARCVPKDKYFNFIQLLFETQKDWLKTNYLSYLKQNAKLTGISGELIDACLNNETLRENMAGRVQAAMNDHGVNATPTLVLNDDVVIRGLSPYADIKAAIDAQLKKVSE